MRGWGSGGEQQEEVRPVAQGHTMGVITRLPHIFETVCNLERYNRQWYPVSIGYGMVSPWLMVDTTSILTETGINNDFQQHRSTLTSQENISDQNTQT
jgi:hypothetical protein